MRIVDLEGLTDQVVDEINGRTFKEWEGDLVNQHRGAVPLDDDIVRLLGPLDVEGVLEAGAAPAVDADAQHRPGRLAVHDLLDAPRGPLGEADWGHLNVHLAKALKAQVSADL